MVAIEKPYFRELSPGEARKLLKRQHVGRIAFTLHDRVDIEPITYASDGQWVFGRTSPGTKLTKLLKDPFCAFETDEVRDQFDWESVVVKGTFYLLDPQSGSPDTYDRALKMLREVVPGTFTPGDPVPKRAILFGIFVHAITGRAAAHSAPRRGRSRRSLGSHPRGETRTPGVTRSEGKTITKAPSRTPPRNSAAAPSPR